MNICIFASGSGTNFKAILEAKESGYLESDILLLITNNSHCPAVEIAKENNVDYCHISRGIFPDLSNKDYSKKFVDSLRMHNIDFIVLAGYMQMIPNEVIQNFENRIINIHPAVLPLFGGKGMYGVNVHKSVIASGMRVTGITIHFVDKNYDEGKIIFQKCINVDFDDDEFSLQKKVHRLEHKYYSEIIKLFEEQRIEIINGKVRVK